MTHTKESLERWRLYLREITEKHTTQNGEHPHRLNSTGFITSMDAIDSICELAEAQIATANRHGKKADALALQHLKRLVAEIESTIE